VSKLSEPSKIRSCPARISRALAWSRSATTPRTTTAGAISERRAAAADALGASPAASFASKRNWRARFDSSTTSRSTSVILPTPARAADSAAAAPMAPTPTNTIENDPIRACPSSPIPGKRIDREYAHSLSPRERVGVRGELSPPSCLPRLEQCPRVLHRRLRHLLPRQHPRDLRHPRLSFEQPHRRDRSAPDLVLLREEVPVRER